MKKITHKHIEAISHSKLFLNKAFATNPEPRFKREIEADLERLNEVRNFLLETMYNPTFQYTPDNQDHGTHILTDGDKDGSENAPS